MPDATIFPPGARTTSRAWPTAAVAYSPVDAAPTARWSAPTPSAGPTNMVTAAAAGAPHRLPVLLVPGDVYASRRPDPYCKQLEDSNDGTVSVEATLSSRVAPLRPASPRSQQLSTRCRKHWRRCWIPPLLSGRRLRSARTCKPKLSSIREEHLLLRAPRVAATAPAGVCAELDALVSAIRASSFR